MTELTEYLRRDRTTDNEETEMGNWGNEWGGRA